MKKVIVAVVAVLIILSSVYYFFLFNEKFSSGAEGVFLSADYKEKYKILTTDIEVNKTKYDYLLIKHDIDLDNGSVKYEIFDPNNKLVISKEVKKDQIYSEKMKLEPIKGKWIIKYYTNKQTNGKYTISMESN